MFLTLDQKLATCMAKKATNELKLRSNGVFLATSAPNLATCMSKLGLDVA